MRIPVFAFPWICWKCKKEMKVTYPFSKAVYKSNFQGNLRETYSKTQQSEVIGNLCPFCGEYQGNWFVEDDGLMENAYDLEKFIVGYIEIEVNCLSCGKELTDENLGDELFIRTEPYRDYLEAEELEPKEKEVFFKKRIDYLYSYWFCPTCSKKIEKERRLQKIRDGPLIKCPLCGKNTKDNPETKFEEHHLSYSPEVKMAVCASCHLKIHHSDAFPNLKPKDKRQPTVRKRGQKEKKKITKEIALGHCPICGRELAKDDSVKIYRGTSYHAKCFATTKEKQTTLS